MIHAAAHLAARPAGESARGRAGVAPLPRVLRNGCYGVAATLLTLAFLALLREPRAEGAACAAPGR